MNKDQLFTITPMMEDFQISPETQVTFEGLLVYVDKFNKGTLGHSDAWFKIHDSNQTELTISDFYPYLTDGESHE